jgi:2-hydroxy-3-oxopropionate reductase
MAVIANRSRKGVDAAVPRGAIEAATPRTLAEASGTVLLCMNSSDTVDARMLGPAGVLAGLRQRAVVIDFGTSRPASTRMPADKTAQAGGHFLDAPLGRTSAHGKEGKLNIMCAGDRDAYDKMKPVRDTLGENVFHLGESGTGHRVKLINNFFAMADAVGGAREKVYSAMAAGPLHCGMMDFVGNDAMDGQIDLVFSLANAPKDVERFTAMAAHLGQDARIGQATLATLSEPVDAGWGDHMVPEMVDYLSKGIPQ